MPSTETVEADTLKLLAPLAHEGVRALYVVGKIKEVRRTSNEKTGEVTVKATCICGEGDTITLKFAPTATLPGVGFQGAFSIDTPREYMNKASANCLGFE